MIKGIAIGIVFTALSCFSQDLEIGLFHKYNATGYYITSEIGQYNVFADSILLFQIKQGERASCRKYGINSVQVSFKGKDYVNYNRISFIPKDSLNRFVINASGKVYKANRSYYGQVDVFYNENSEKLRSVNLVDAERYLEGVLESESGGSQNVEYYKVQAVMSRTFALNNTHRHSKDGYGVCDGVHCQAYYSRQKYTPNISKAVKASEGEVILDENKHLIHGFFHANCGGQTVLSSFIWNKDLPYIKSVKDTFCIHTRQSKWKVEVPKWEWYKYMRDKFDVVMDSSFKREMYNFSQNNRLAFFSSPIYGIPMVFLRTDFKLKSTFFSVEEKGDKILLNGRGFGHGVGLCQEGAMSMSKTMDYKSIINFYFKDVKIVPYYFALENVNNGIDFSW
jgi:stage II sporulation protein D